MLKLYWKYFRITIIGLIVSFLTVIIVPSFHSYTLAFNYLSYTITPSSSIIVAQSSEKDEEKTAEEEEKNAEEVEEADVLVDGKAIFTIKTFLGELSPEVRAKTAMSNLEDVAQNTAISPEEIKIVNVKELGLIQGGDTIIITFAEEDAEAENLTFLEFVNDRLEDIETAIIDYRKARTKTSIFQGVIKAIIATIIAIFSLYLLRKVLPSLFDRMRAWQRERLESVEFQGLQFISGRQVAQFISFLFTVTRIFLVFLVFYIYVPLVLSYFPWTQPIGIKLLTNFWDTINLVISGILSYLPNLFIIVVIGMIAYYSIRFAHIFFNAIGDERIRINGFYPEWAEPTYNLIMFFIVGLAGVLIFPYLPASNSAGFQGISIFAGALFTLGSTAIVGNIVSGIVLIYTRSFQVGDVITANDKTGRVLEKSMLTTRIMTPDNEVITIPNATLLASDITNYTASIRDQKRPLVLKTTVTLGYDVPWRKVHEVLINAAKDSEGILENPEPFVLQTSLDDFYVAYTIKAFTNIPEKMALTYSTLHQSIQDKCNEADIEILSPHYSAIRDGHQITIPENYLPSDYQAPRFRVESLGGVPKKNNHNQ
ncbi:mechanosensitive ion channel family protein [Crocosphaera sp.]|uniref:mechanosensitive ion channel family protein n=1 Tax=Crocosphaera sp. TaxID=2729996 RepID=UPI00261F4049|nr:mechanosensitive ion channel family protein [Crocosphaera sp.]MDJ0582617.1 mechanosensitive ion channel family protein [Crocosphaera sp.]